MTTHSIIFCGGCFWCTQAAYENISGVITTTAGYVHNDPNIVPDYRSVSNGQITAREGVWIDYQNIKVLQQLLEIFWRHIDPIDQQGQFADRGYQYTTAIYYQNQQQKQIILNFQNNLENQLQAKFTTETLPMTHFTTAEDYHQNYKQKNPSHYEQYHQGSGRARFTADFWKNKHFTFLRKYLSVNQQQ